MSWSRAGWKRNRWDNSERNGLDVCTIRRSRRNVVVGFVGNRKSKLIELNILRDVKSSIT